MEGAAAGVAAFILAGGQSRRMGTDKAFVVLDGRTLLERLLELARGLTSDVHIVGDWSKFAAFGSTVEDVFPCCGPLGGIHAAMSVSRAELNLMLAVDVPFVSPALLTYLTERARSCTATVTVARVGGGWQPLCAVYRPDFAAMAESALRQGHYKIDALFDQARIEVIREEELQAAGLSAAMFRNLNTPQDLEAAQGAELSE